MRQKWRASESRARTTRPLPAAIALPPSLAIEVRHQNELVGELAFGVAQHEAFLVGADRRADHLGRDFQELRLEFAHQHDRPFDEARDFLEQAFVLDEFEPCANARLLRVGEIICLRRSASSTTLALASAST